MKFRIWDKKAKLFRKSNPFRMDAISVCGNYLISFSDGDGWDNPRAIQRSIDKFIVEQFIGAVDKNGNEIFVGDIVRFSSDETIDFNCLVVEAKDYCSFGFKIRSGEGLEDLFLNHKPIWKIGTNVYEVVGNIHESPELFV